MAIDWQFCAPADPQAKGVVERLQDSSNGSFEPGQAFANELDQLQLDTWFSERANVRFTKRCAAARSTVRSRNVG